jgi:hypothetical protein
MFDLVADIEHSYFVRGHGLSSKQRMFWLVAKAHFINVLFFEGGMPCVES